MLLERDAVIGALSTLLVAIKDRRRAIRPKAPVIMSPTVYRGSSPIPTREECAERRLMGLDNADPIETALEQAVRHMGEILPAVIRSTGCGRSLRPRAQPAPSLRLSIIVGTGFLRSTECGRRDRRPPQKSTTPTARAATYDRSV